MEKSNLAYTLVNDYADKTVNTLYNNEITLPPDQMTNKYFMRLMQFQTSDLFRSSGYIAIDGNNFTTDNAHFYSVTELVTTLQDWIDANVSVDLVISALNSSGAAATDNTFDHFTIANNSGGDLAVQFFGDFAYLFSTFGQITVVNGAAATTLGLQSPYKVKIVKLVSDNIDGCNLIQQRNGQSTQYMSGTLNVLIPQIQQTYQSRVDDHVFKVLNPGLISFRIVDQDNNAITCCRFQISLLFFRELNDRPSHQKKVYYLVFDSTTEVIFTTNPSIKWLAIDQDQVYFRENAAALADQWITQEVYLRTTQNNSIQKFSKIYQENNHVDNNNFSQYLWKPQGSAGTVDFYLKIYEVINSTGYRESTQTNFMIVYRIYTLSD